jgi:hypothetical protein
MNIYSILIIVLIISFFIVFFYFIFTNNNKLLKFTVIKNNIIQNNQHHKEDESVKVKNKNFIKTCQDMCKNSFCDEYHSQVIKYDLCRECKKENKCYDPFEGLCVPCKNNYTCEQLYGCNNSAPINPVENLCTKCWQ